MIRRWKRGMIKIRNMLRTLRRITGSCDWVPCDFVDFRRVAPALQGMLKMCSNLPKGVRPEETVCYISHAVKIISIFIIRVEFQGMRE